MQEAGARGLLGTVLSFSLRIFVFLFFSAESFGRMSHALREYCKKLYYISIIQDLKVLYGTGVCT